MTAIDVDSLLKPISDAAPCGTDLEYSGEIDQLRLLKEGERRAVGDNIEPNLPAACNLAIDLLSTKTKDLRVAAILTQAALAVDGLVAFRDGMRLLTGLLDDAMWDSVYPRIDPDDNDPAQRRFALESLADRFTLLHFQKIPEIAGNFADCDAQQLESLDTVLTDVKRTANAIEESFNKRFAGGNDQEKQISLYLLTGKVDESLQVLKELRPELPSPLIEEDVPEDGSSTSPASSAFPTNGAITSRKQVEEALDRIKRYYRDCEPASPVPVLIDVSRKLMWKDFFEVVEILPQELVAKLKEILAED